MCVCVSDSCTSYVWFTWVKLKDYSKSVHVHQWPLGNVAYYCDASKIRFRTLSSSVKLRLFLAQFSIQETFQVLWASSFLTYSSIMDRWVMSFFPTLRKIPRFRSHLIIKGSFWLPKLFIWTLPLGSCSLLLPLPLHIFSSLENIRF